MEDRPAGTCLQWFTCPVNDAQGALNGTGHRDSQLEPERRLIRDPVRPDGHPRVEIQDTATLW